MFKHIRAALLAFFAAAMLATASTGVSAAVDINKASLAELEAVKGVGTATAAKILDERKKASFKDWADLMQRVGGIKQARAGKLSEAGLTVNGEAFKPAAASADKAAKPADGKVPAKK
jgi:competence protein ComEA